MGDDVALDVPYALFSIVVTFLSEPFGKPVNCDAVAIIADDQAEAIVCFRCASALGAIREVGAFLAGEIFRCLSTGDAILNKADSAFSAELSPFVRSLNAVVRTHGLFLRFGKSLSNILAGRSETWPSSPCKHILTLDEIHR